MHFSLYSQRAIVLYLSFFHANVMQKTRKSVSKKFKVTGSGKVMHRSAGKRHLLRNKSQKQKNRAGKDRETAPGVARMVKIAAPGLF